MKGEREELTITTDIFKNKFKYFAIIFCRCDGDAFLLFYDEKGDHFIYEFSPYHGTITI